MVVRGADSPASPRSLSRTCSQPTREHGSPCLMCGIAGIVTPGVPVQRDVLARMVRAMSHRGPDSEHFWRRDDVAVGMRRLAIVDVQGGAQPLRNEAGTIHVVFNGEIYNHQALRDELLARGHRL